MTTLLLIMLVGFPALVALLTYTLYCYEETNSAGTPFTKLLPNVLPTILKSYLSEVAILFLYPVGLWPSLWSRPSGDRPVVVLVHGLFHNPSAWALFRHRLRTRGYAVACFAYPSWGTDIASVEAKLEQFLLDICTTCPGRPVHLVGHSLGGLLLRGVLGNMDVPGQIRTLSTLGTPFGGSKLAPFAFNSIGHDLMHDGPLVRTLATRPFPAHVRLLVLRAPADNMVLPNTALGCNVRGCTEKQTPHSSHLSMLYSRPVFNEVAQWLDDAEKTGDLGPENLGSKSKD